MEEVKRAKNCLTDQNIIVSRSPSCFAILLGALLGDVMLLWQWVLVIAVNVIEVTSIDMPTGKWESQLQVPPRPLEKFILMSQFL